MTKTSIVTLCRSFLETYNSILSQNCNTTCLQRMLDSCVKEGDEHGSKFVCACLDTEQMLLPLINTISDALLKRRMDHLAYHFKVTDDVKNELVPIKETCEIRRNELNGKWEKGQIKHTANFADDQAELMQGIPRRKVDVCNLIMEAREYGTETTKKLIHLMPVLLSINQQRNIIQRHSILYIALLDTGAGFLLQEILRLCIDTALESLQGGKAETEWLNMVLADANDILKCRNHEEYKKAVMVCCDTFAKRLDVKYHGTNRGIMLQYLAELKRDNQRIRSGDEDAFQKTVRKYAGLIKILNALVEELNHRTGRQSECENENATGNKSGSGNESRTSRKEEISQLKIDIDECGGNMTEFGELIRQLKGAEAGKEKEEALKSIKERLDEAIWL